MRTAFVITAEPTPAYANMAKLCAWSIRTRAGALADASISVVFNDELHADAAAELRGRWDVHIERRPRLSESMKCMNKYNGLFAAAAQEADWVILLDCDTAVVNPLDPLADWMRSGEHDFGASLVDSARVWGLDQLVMRHSNLSSAELTPHRTADRARLPYFNGGVIALRGTWLDLFRRAVIDYSHELFESMRAGGGHPVQWARVQWNRVMSRRPATERFIAAPFFHKGYADQIAIVLAMMKLRLRYRILPREYNWLDERFDPSEPDPIRIFHYLGAYYPIDRERLFDGDWIDEFKSSAKRGRRTLAELASECAEESRIASSR